MGLRCHPDHDDDDDDDDDGDDDDDDDDDSDDDVDNDYDDANQCVSPIFNSGQWASAVTLMMMTTMMMKTTMMMMIRTIMMTMNTDKIQYLASVLASLSSTEHVICDPPRVAARGGDTFAQIAHLKAQNQSLFNILRQAS